MKLIKPPLNLTMNVIYTCSLIFALSGCASFTHDYNYYISKPNYTEYPNNTLYKKGILNLKEAKIHIRPSNYVKYRKRYTAALFIVRGGFHEELFFRDYKNREFESEYYPNIDPNYFIVEVAVSAKKGPVYFNPRDLYYQIGDGKKIFASSYLFPSNSLVKNHNNVIRPLCSKQLGREFKYSKSRWFKIEAGRSLCFAIKLKVAVPQPFIEFQIGINKMKYDQYYLRFESISFSTKRELFRGQE